MGGRINDHGPVVGGLISEDQRVEERVAYAQAHGFLPPLRLHIPGPIEGVSINECFRKLRSLKVEKRKRLEQADLPGSLSFISRIHLIGYVPAGDRQSIGLNDVALSSELLRLTDAHTDELFPVTPVEAGRVVFPLSRLVCDVERFPSDERRANGCSGHGCHLYAPRFAVP